MKKPLVGAFLAICGGALVFFAERFGDYQFAAGAAGIVLLLLGSSLVTALQDYWVQLEAAAKKKADKSNGS